MDILPDGEYNVEFLPTTNFLRTDTSVRSQFYVLDGEFKGRTINVIMVKHRTDILDSLLLAVVDPEYIANLCADNVSFYSIITLAAFKCVRAEIGNTTLYGSYGPIGLINAVTMFRRYNCLLDASLAT